MHPLTDQLPDHMDALALRQACGEIEERVTRERNEAHAALDRAYAELEVKGEYGYSQHVVDALSKDRDALRAEVATLREQLRASDKAHDDLIRRVQWDTGL